MSSQTSEAADPIFERNEQLFAILVPYLDLSAIFILCNLADGDYEYCISRTKRYKDMMDDLDFMIDDRRQFLIEAMRKYGIFALNMFCDVIGCREFKYAKHTNNPSCFKDGRDYFLPAGALAIVYSDPYFAAWFEKEIKISTDAAGLKSEKEIAAILSGEIHIDQYNPRNGNISAFIAANIEFGTKYDGFEHIIIRKSSYNLAKFLRNKTAINIEIIDSLHEYSHENEDFVRLLKNIIARNMLAADTLHMLLCRDDKFGDILAEIGVASMPPKNIDRIMAFLIDVGRTHLFEKYFDKDIFLDDFVRHEIMQFPPDDRRNFTAAMANAKKYHPQYSAEIDLCYVRAIIESENSSLQELKDVLANYDVWRMISAIGIKVARKHMDFYRKQLLKN